MLIHPQFFYSYFLCSFHGFFKIVFSASVRDDTFDAISIDFVSLLHLVDEFGPIHILV